VGDEKNFDDCVSAHDALIRLYIRRVVWVSFWKSEIRLSGGGSGREYFNTATPTVYEQP
jgi:hypothetical protein